MAGSVGDFGIHGGRSVVLALRGIKSWPISRDVWWLTLAQGLWGLGLGLYGMFFPLYVEKLGGGPVVVGFLTTVAGVATALVVFPGGWLADRVDRRSILVWGWVVAVPVPWLFAWAPHWQWLIPGVLLYFGSAFSTPALQAVIVEEAAPGQLAFSYNVVMSVFGAGMVLGPAIGGYLASRFSYGLVFTLSGLIYTASTVAVWQIRSHPARPRPKRPAAWKPAARPRFFQWMLFAAALSVIQGFVWPYVVPYWKSVGHLSMETIGLLGSVAMAAVTLTGPLWARVGDRVGIPKALGAGLGLLAAGWLLLLWMPESLGWGLLSSLLRGIGEGSRGLQGVALGRVAKPGEIGTAYGLFNLATELAGALAPLPGGLLFAHWVYGPLVLGIFFTAIIGWWLLNGLPGRPTPVPPIAT